VSPGRFVAPLPADLAKRFPQLEVLELLGQGGMGAVYKARQTKLDRLVALKILPPEAGRDPAFAARFLREARALARLSHPHVVAVHDFGEVEGLFYLVMEFVDGADLRRALRSGLLPPAEALKTTAQVCDALQYAHEEGVVHRDIKPENILLDKRGRVKIADFGLVKLLGYTTAGVPLTASQQVMGTLHYMAPEQFERPLAVDHRADIYSVGVVLYEMLTGGLPLGHFARPSQKAAVDVRVDEVVLRALAKEPDRRYQQAGEMRTALDAVTCSTPTTTIWAAPPRRAELSEPARKEIRRRLAGPALGLILAGLLACAAALYLCYFLWLWVSDRHYIPPSTPSVILTATFILIGMVQGVFVIVGALAMLGRQTYKITRLGSVLALLPLTPAFAIGLPVGIWALAVLGEPGVRSAFAGEQGEGADRQPGWLARVAGFFGSTTGWATILSLVGLVGCLCPWLISTHPMHGYAFVVGPRISAAVIFLALLLFLLVTGFLQPVRLWQSVTWMVAGLSVVLSMSTFHALAVAWHVGLEELDPGVYLPLAAGVGLLLVGSIQLRGVLMRLHAARGARPDETASPPRRG
jgi:tRNA A-37 threonylcarbamoyl transferase component Bud32